jgi:type IV secretory pathway VirD2 relaxase
LAGFNTSGQGVEIAAQLARWQAAGDERLWKLIISPEFGDRVDLPRLTRDLVGRMERDLDSPLEWVAVAHHNTEHPHVHVALRGIRSDGQPLHLPREYVKEGIRAIRDMHRLLAGTATDQCSSQASSRGFSVPLMPRH